MARRANSKAFEKVKVSRINQNTCKIIIKTVALEIIIRNIPFYACRALQIGAILTKHDSNASSESDEQNYVLSLGVPVGS